MRHDYERHQTNVNAARDFTAAWARFLDTRCGYLLQEHTSLVRNLSTDGVKARRTLVAIVLVPVTVLILLAVLLHLPMFFALAFAVLVMLTIIVICLWGWYDASPQQAADRLITNPHLLTRRGCSQQLSDRSLSLSLNHALPATRAALDAHSATSNTAISPRLGGVLLGACHGVSAWLAAERPAYVLSPPRGGKTTSVVIPLIMEAPGPVVATSSRKDILDATFCMRATGYTCRDRVDCDGAAPSFEGDDVWVFDPLGIVADIPRYAKRRIIWNPVTSCTDAKKARTLATALVSSAQFSNEDATWARIGVDITQALLLAAALSGKGLDTVFLWSQDMTGITHAKNILQSHSENPTALEWAQPLVRLGEDDLRTASNKLLTMSSAFSALSLPQVRQWFAPTADRPFDMSAFLHSRQTVYMLSELRPVSGQADASAAVFNCMFLDDLRDSARTIAASSEYGRLEPSLAVILDECANIAPWASLPQLFTAGSGDGIWPVAVFQSREQAKAVFSKEESQMWDSSQKIILGGLAEQTTLNDVSHLTGQYREHYQDQSYHTNALGMLIQAADGINMSERSENKYALTPEDVRTIAPKCALLITHNIPAAAVLLIPYWQRGYQPLVDDTSVVTPAGVTVPVTPRWDAAPTSII